MPRKPSADEARDQLRDKPLAAEEVVGIGRLEAGQPLERTDVRVSGPASGTGGVEAGALLDELQPHHALGYRGLCLPQARPLCRRVLRRAAEAAARLGPGPLARHLVRRSGTPRSPRAPAPPERRLRRLRRGGRRCRAPSAVSGPSSRTPIRRDQPTRRPRAWARRRRDGRCRRRAAAGRRSRLNRLERLEERSHRRRPDPPGPAASDRLPGRPAQRRRTP